MSTVKKAVLKFQIPDRLPLSYGHYLRGFFARRYEDVLFHNHREDGTLHYHYPLIQYKIIDGLPYVIGLGKGAELVAEKFLGLEQLSLNGKVYRGLNDSLQIEEEELAVDNELPVSAYEYTFISPWIGLNQKNFRQYQDEVKQAGKKKRINFLSRILIGNILSLAKGIGWWIEEEIVAGPKVEEVPVRFRGNQFVGFKGVFYSNIRIPKLVGLGKLTSRGFGSLRRTEFF